jgi:predicted transcriptional regulator
VGPQAPLIFCSKYCESSHKVIILHLRGDALVKLIDIQAALKAEVVLGEQWLQKEATGACGADLMSDVLAFTKERAVLLTGLTNVQVIRTAEISDLVAIVFVRGKRPGKDVIQMAAEKEIPLMVSEYALYEACGLLYQQGLPGCSRQVARCE